MLLSHAEINEALRALPGWTSEGASLRRTYEFAGFPEAVAFTTQLVAPAEAMGHHPDLAIRYNKVVVTLTTHDAGGITRKDLELARVISGL